MSRRTPDRPLPKKPALPSQKKSAPPKVEPIPRVRVNKNVNVEKQREHARAWQRRNSASTLDIAPLPYDTINWKRRLECQKSLKKFAETYMSNVFYMGWSHDQLRCIDKVETVMHGGGMFAMAMPRGGGKTAICRAGLLQGVCYGLRRFLYFLGSTDDKSHQSLEFIKTYLFRNQLLREDFPEICHSVEKLDNRWHKAASQLYLGQQTCVEWGSAQIRLPCLLLPKEVAEWYLDHDPESIRQIPQYGEDKVECNVCDGSGLAPPGQGLKYRQGDPGYEAVLERLEQSSVPAGTIIPADPPGAPGSPGRGRSPHLNPSRPGATNIPPKGRSAKWPPKVITSPDCPHCAGRGFILLPKEDVWIARQAGIILRTSGIDGSIRGEALVHPITLEQPRPDLVLLDDVQKEQKADSPILCEKLVRMIDGAVQGLAGPGRHINCLMPGTVIREGDVMDTYLNPMIKPEWQGERCSMVISWPDGITDLEVTNETEAGKLWNQYSELYRKSLREFQDFRLCTDLYQKNRAIMDGGELIDGTWRPNGKGKGFVCSWPDRYNREGNLKEVSAQQHAFNLRLKLGPMFLSEYQNQGRKLDNMGVMMITADQLAAKTISTKKFHVPADTQVLVGFIDVQMELLFRQVFACNMDYTGMFPYYGTWPEMTMKYFTKDQTLSWSMLTTGFFQEYPEYRKNVIKTAAGHIRAPLEAKLYWALDQCVTEMRSWTFMRDGTPPVPMKITKIAIDTRWGDASETIKRFIRETGDQNLIPYYGQDLPPTHRQFEEYEKRTGWLFENMISPHIREPKWCMKPNPDGMVHMMADVNRLKDFLMVRLSSPKGSPGSISLYDAPAEEHELFASHVCNSEYPEPVRARNLTKNQWKVREGIAFDNDYLDTSCGLMALASLEGASIKTTDDPKDIIVRKLSQIAQSKRRAS